MKITFSNLGTIKKTTLDLRPLTVIIGPNNSNKTYIAYSIYGLLRGIAITAMAPLVFGLGYEVGNETFSNDIQKIYQIDSNGSYLLKINNDFLRLLSEDTSQLTQNFEENLKDFFQDTSRKLFEKTKFEIKLSLEELRDAFNKLVSSEDYVNSEKLTYILDKNLFSARIKKDFDFFEKVPLQHFVANSILFELKSLLYPQTFLLPAERNALIISYKILENRRYELLKNANRNRFAQQNLPHKHQLNLFETMDVPLQEDVRYSQPSIDYPQPIEDFLKFLTNLDLENPLEKGIFAEFAENIEKDLQKGDKTNYIFRELGGREIKINVEKDLDIDLYNASSSIKQLAPLLLYLRYRAKEGDLLIIDEPEMNLHPESQAKLLEILGMLVNAGVKVLLTTHSPYFMSHLNNLIAGDMNDEKIREKQAKSLYLQDARAFLSPNDVSAYEMRQNKAGNQTLHDLKDEDYGIRWDTLSDVSDEIQKKFFEIYENGKKASKGKEK